MSIQLGNGNWAVKEDKLLAYKKVGDMFFNKEFDFARGSSATYVGKDGLIKTAGLTSTNLVQNGDFSQEGQNWQTQSDTVMSFTNDTLVITNNGIGRGAWQNLTTITGRKYRFEAKSDSHVTNALIRVTNSPSSPSSGFGDAYVINGVAVLEFIALSTTTNLYLRNSTVGTSIWKSASVKEIETDTPRIDFSDSPKGALLLEPSSTNHIKKSEKPEDWTITEFGSGGVSTVTTGFDDVMGGKNAVKVDWASDADNAALLFDETSSIQPTSSNSLITMYVKLLEEGTKIIRFRTNSGSINVTINSTSFTRIQGLVSSGASSFELKCRPSQGTSNGGYSLILCQPQIEDAVFATSYIPTYGTTATRLAETCINSGLKQDFNSEEGVLYAEIGALTNISTATKRVITLKNTNSSKRLSIIYHIDSTLAFYFSESPTVYYQTSAYDITQYSKIAFKYKENDFAVWVNGVEIFTDTSNNTFTAHTLNGLHFNESGTNNPFYGKVKELKTFKRALSDTELYLLTTPVQYQSYEAMAATLNYTI